MAPNTDKLNPKEHEDIDALLARELNEMSIKERETLYEEMHGISAAVDETPEMVEIALAQLQIEIQNIKDKPAYDQAQQAAPEYIQSRKFCLMFLRAQLFDTEKAAAHLVSFLEGKCKLFGPETLTRPIYFSDLDDDDIACLQTGVYQVLPTRDTAGRPSVMNCTMLLKEKCYKTIKNMLRAFSYIIMSLFEDDEETQRKGYCGIVYFIGKASFEFDKEFQSESAKLNDWLPARIASIHFCSDDSFVQAFRPVLMAAWTKAIRVRCRIHTGSNTECQYSMMTFGLPVSSLPVTYDGTLKNANHLRWVDKQKARDKRQLSLGYFDGVDIPGEKDVLLGRGRTYQDHGGNVRMRQLVKARLKEYQAETKDGKNSIHATVVAKVHEYEGRFLKRDSDGWWVRSSQAEAEKRVLMSFRTALSSPPKRDQVTAFLATENGKRSRLHADYHGRHMLSTCFGASA